MRGLLRGLGDWLGLWFLCGFKGEIRLLRLVESRLRFGLRFLVRLCVSYLACWSFVAAGQGHNIVRGRRRLFEIFLWGRHKLL